MFIFPLLLLESFILLIPQQWCSEIHVQMTPSSSSFSERLVQFIIQSAESSFAALSRLVARSKTKLTERQDSEKRIQLEEVFQVMIQARHFREVAVSLLRLFSHLSSVYLSDSTTFVCFSLSSLMRCERVWMMSSLSRHDWRNALWSMSEHWSKAKVLSQVSICSRSWETLV